LEKLEGAPEIWLVFQHSPRNPVDLVGQKMNRVLTFDESGEHPARDEALDRHLNRLRVAKVIALKIDEHWSYGLA